MRCSLGLAVFILLVAASTGLADSATYVLSMDGFQEIPPSGSPPADPDGVAIGTISLNDITGEISWDVAYSNIASPTLFVIHGPNGPAGTSASPFIILNTSGNPGTLIGSRFSPSSNITDILSDPVDFYVNIHTAEFSDGAVRGQLGVLVPEPSTVTLAVLGMSGLLACGRRRKRHCA